MDFLTRPEWGARLALGPPMRLPAQGIHVHHTVTTPTSDPAADMRTLERIGGQRFGRFSYSWALHPVGAVGEGAGLTIGAHTAGWNSTSFGIAFIGNYQHDQLTGAQIEAFRHLRRHLLDAGHLAPGHWVEPHGHRAATACPGRHITTPTVWAQLLALPQEDLVMDDAHFKNLVRQVLNEGTGRGQTSWAGTNKAVLAGVQANHNRLNAIRAAQLTPDEFAAAVAARLPAGTIDVATIRAAVADELHARLAS